MRLNLATFIIILFLWGPAAADIINDLEDNDATNNIGTGYITKYESDFNQGPDPQTSSIVSPGANGSDYCFQLTVDGSEDAETGNGGQCLIDGLYYGNLYAYIFSAISGQGVRIPATAGHDRISFWVKLGINVPEGASYNLNVGTYTLNPDDPNQAQNGTHFYHWFNIPQSAYWTKCIVNSHPQTQCDVAARPTNNPVAWDYWPNMTRFYVDATGCSTTGGYTGYLDEFIAYSPSEPEDDDNIGSLSCTYMGAGRFILHWYNSPSSLGPLVEDTYDVYYSASPLTNANYTSGTLIDDDVTQAPGRGGTYYDNYFVSDVNTGITSGTVYFAIKDNAGDAPAYVSKIDYAIDGVSDTTPPTVTISTGDPQSVSTSSIEIAWTDSDDTAVTSRKWRIGSAPDASNGTICTSPATITGLSVGANTVYIGAVDEAGNWGSDSITVNYSPVASGAIIINSGFRGGGGVR